MTTSPYLSLKPRALEDARMDIRCERLRNLVALEIAEEAAWNRGERVLSISYRKRAIALRNLLALTNAEVPETADEEARRIAREGEGYTQWQPISARGEL